MPRQRAMLPVGLAGKMTGAWVARGRAWATGGNHQAAEAMDEDFVLDVLPDGTTSGGSVPGAGESFAMAGLVMRSATRQHDFILLLEQTYPDEEGAAAVAWQATVDADAAGGCRLTGGEWSGGCCGTFEAARTDSPRAPAPAPQAALVSFSESTRGEALVPSYSKRTDAETAHARAIHDALVCARSSTGGPRPLTVVFDDRRNAQQLQATLLSADPLADDFMLRLPDGTERNTIGARITLLTPASGAADGSDGDDGALARNASRLRSQLSRNRSRDLHRQADVERGRRIQAEREKEAAERAAQAAAAEIVRTNPTLAQQVSVFLRRAVADRCA